MERDRCRAAAGDFGRVPRGEYVCHVTQGELESSRTKGTPGYKIEFTILDGDFKGRKLWLDCWLTPAALPQSKRDFLGGTGGSRAPPLRLTTKYFKNAHQRNSTDRP